MVKRVIYLIFLILFIPFLLGAKISECETLESDLLIDNCYIDNAKDISDCDNIRLKSSHYNKCLIKFFETYSDEQQCDKVPVSAKSNCISLVTFNNDPNNISACYALLYSYQKDCIKTYIQKKRTNDPNYCLNIKQEFQRECAYQASLNKYPPFLSDAEISVCNEYSGDIKEGCKDLFKFKKIAKGFVFGFLGVFGFILLFLILGLVFIVTILIIIIVVLSKKKKKKEMKKIMK